LLYQGLGSAEEKTAIPMNRFAWGMASCLCLALICAPARPAAAAGGKATLTIHVENVLSGGLVRLGLYNRALYPDDNSTPLASADVPAVAGETIIVLHDLAPGEYAIQTYQDVNGNDKMDTSWIGLPQEPFGFSRDAKPFLSKPSFDEVKFTIVDGDNSQTLHLQNMSKPSPADKARDAVRARQHQ
jgi:uncharacterized protein (DUF2141 family)